MRRVCALIVVVGCGGGDPSPPPPSPVPAPVVELPTDGELGELAIRGVPSGGGTWIPVVDGAFLVDATPHTGLGPMPSWRATDRRGMQEILRYGETSHVAYGCEGNQLTVTTLVEELQEGSLEAGLVWLTPLGAPWSGRPVAITNARAVRSARRELRVGRYTIEIVRTDPTHGVVSVLHDGDKLVHQMTFGREDRAERDDGPIDLLAGGNGVPIPEAAWSIEQDRLLLVFKVEQADGLGFKTIAVGPEGGRTVRSMGIYLERCASRCSS